MKFKLHRNTMNVTGVRVKIYDEGKCTHEHETIRSDENDLRTLIKDLRDMQTEVNDFLTALIQRRDTSGGAQEVANLRSISSNVESDSVEDEDEDEDENEKEEEVEEGETRANPKKCKLSI